ncbi:MAG TPA: hypothetical protein VF654_18610 [Pyrinomonadaceae bacterium]
MKLKAFVHGLAIPVVVAAVLEQNTLVAITGNKTVNKAGAGAVVLGRLLKPAREANGTGTVETRFKERIAIKADGAIAAGDRVKMAAADGDGIQRVKKWVSQTDLVAGDTPDTLLGVCLVGGADAADVEVLTY